MKQTINHNLKRCLFKISVSIILFSIYFFMISYSPVSAQAQTTICAFVQPMSNNLSWAYKTENGKLYKRLYNQTTHQWIGGWIYVCDCP